MVNESHPSSLLIHHHSSSIITIHSSLLHITIKERLLDNNTKSYFTAHPSSLLMHHHCSSIITTHSSLLHIKGTITEWQYEFVYYCTQIITTHLPSLLVHYYYKCVVTTHSRYTHWMTNPLLTMVIGGHWVTVTQQQWLCYTYSIIILIKHIKMTLIKRVGHAVTNVAVTDCGY